MKYDLAMAGRPDDASLSYVNVARAKRFAEYRRKAGQKLQVWTLKEGSTFVGYAITEITDRIPPTLYVGEIYLEPHLRNDRKLWTFFIDKLKATAKELGCVGVHYSPVVR